MRKLTVLLATAGLLLGFSGISQAGVFVEPTSTLGLAIGGLPEVNVAALPGTSSLVAMSDGSQGNPTVGHNIVVGTTGGAATVWSTVNFGPGTALFTGVPLISNLKVTMNNQQGILQDGAFPTATNQIGGGGTFGPTFGGIMRLSGVAVVFAGNGAIQLPVPLSHVGGNMGETTMGTLLGSNLTVTAGPFIAGTWVITGLTTNQISIPARPAIGVAFTLQPTPAEDVKTPTTNGGFVSTATVATPNRVELNTVTVAGTNNLLSGSSAGTVTVISPLRINTSDIAGVIPGGGTAHFEFVPEPGTMLLLVSGAVGLAVIGRRRMRK